MKNKRYAKNPLLYIHQPDVGTPAASMQSSYRASKRNSSPQSETHETGRKIKGRPQRRQGKPMPEIKEVEDIQSESSLDKNENPKEEFINDHTGSKKFKDMTLFEKVKYFADDPSHIPKMKCEIKTEERTYRGIIVDFDGETVFMRMGRRVNTRKVLFKEIKRIRMLGF